MKFSLFAILLLLNIVSAFITATLIYNNKLYAAVAVMLLTLVLDKIAGNTLNASSSEDAALTLVLAYIIALTFFTAAHMIKLFSNQSSIISKLCSTITLYTKR